MKIERFEDILAWQKAKQLTLSVYSKFTPCKDYSFKNQIERASVSVMNNIAEGFERHTNKELRNFFYISKGSCGEVRSMIRLAEELKYIKKEDATMLLELATEVSKILSGFIKRLY